MKITEIRVKLASQNEIESMLCYATMTLDDVFVIHDLKLINGRGGPFVAMPGRPYMDKCDRCGKKNALRARYCNDCGIELGEAPAQDKIFTDICHPINTSFRDEIKRAVLAAYDKEIERSRTPGYIIGWNIWRLPYNNGGTHEEESKD